ncbi:hypothetical protein [Cellulomonas sp. Marseille-Q8402]
MGRSGRRAVAWATGALAVLVLAGCAPDGDVTVTNESGQDVTVLLGDEDLGVVGADGGVVLLSVTACYDGPLVVTYADGRAVDLDETVCPGQELLVGTGAVRVRGTSVLDEAGS